MLLRFDSRANRDAVVDPSPIIHHGGHVNLERSKKTSNRFVIRFPWLAAVMATVKVHLANGILLH